LTYPEVEDYYFLNKGITVCAAGGPLFLFRRIA